MVYLFTVSMGIIVGYNFKPVVLWCATAVIGFCIALSGGILLTESDHSLADILPFAVIIIGSIFLFSMWISRSYKGVKQEMPGVSMWSRLKDKTLDTVKKSDE